MSLGEAIERLREVVAVRLGLTLDDERLAEALIALEERIERTRAGSLVGYLDLLEAPGRQGELGELAARVTVGETYFFRNPPQLAAFVEVMLPERAAAASGRPLRILSAGCSSGEEAYTLAILLGRQVPPPLASVLGIDVNPAAIARARRGCYSEWSLRQVPDDVRGRELARSGKEWSVEPSVRARVSFEERNLSEPDAAFWGQAAFDVVFFRNVGMYLSPAVFQAAIERCARSLVPGGWLVLGDAETLRGITTRFELCHTHGAFYYRLRGGRPAPARTPAGTTAPEPAGPGRAGDTTWVGTIGQAMARVHSIERSRSPDRPAAGPDLPRLIELVGGERLDEAHAAIEELPGAAQDAPEVLLLRAIVLTNKGEVAAAGACCDRLLQLEPLSAGAHYLRALSAEHAGDLLAAMEHDRTAAHLDPSFAMPRLHLGLLARRSGSLAESRRELGLAKDLLAREDPGRILLFGGGFTRESLVALCTSAAGPREASG